MKLFNIFILSLFASVGYSQKGKFYVLPTVGIQVPFSKVSSNNYTKGILTNNIIDVEDLFGIRFEYYFADDKSITLSLQNGAAGYSIKVDSKQCPGYNGSFFILGSAESYDNRRLSVGYQFKLPSKKITQKAFYIKKYLHLGLGVDIRSNETEQPDFNFSGLNRCGEPYTVKRVASFRESASLCLPIECKFELMKNTKKIVGLSFSYTQGLTTNTVFYLDYITPLYTDRAILKTKGSGISIALQFPIALNQRKK